MAKQNFLSGGYYGKLGVTVGQRWKNIRTIRTWVKPANPRTEKQQANRNLFGNATALSQLGNQMNYYATCFQNDNFTTWNYRMRTVRQLQNRGLTGMDLIPLYPSDFTPPFLITQASVTEITAAREVTLAVLGDMPASDRVLSVLVDYRNSTGVSQAYKLYVGYYKADNPNVITFEIDDGDVLTEDCYIRLVSCDDTDSNTDMVASPAFKLIIEAREERDFLYSVKSITASKTGYHIVFNEPWKVSTSTTFTGRLRGVQRGSWVFTDSVTTYLTEDSGYFAVDLAFAETYSEDVLAFPSGSYLDITTIKAEAPTYIYLSESVETSCQNSDLERTVERTPEITQGLSGATYFTYPLTSGTAFQDNIQITALCRNMCASTTPYTYPAHFYYNGIVVGYTLTDGWAEMAFRSGDYVTFPAGQIQSEGVTYTIPEKTVSYVNDVTSVTVPLQNLLTEVYPDWSDLLESVTLFLSDFVFASEYELDDGVTNATMTFQDGSQHSIAAPAYAEENESQIYCGQPWIYINNNERPREADAPITYNLVSPYWAIPQNNGITYIFQGSFTVEAE